MTLTPLVKINLGAFLILFLVIFITFRMFTEIPPKNITKKFKSKGVEKTVVFLVRSFSIILSLVLIIFVNIPVLQDTFPPKEPISLIGKVSFVNRSLFFPFTFWLNQNFTINKVHLHTLFNPEIIIQGKAYKVTYLPHSKAVLTIERLD